MLRSCRYIGIWDMTYVRLTAYVHVHMVKQRHTCSYLTTAHVFLKSFIFIGNCINIDLEQIIDFFCYSTTTGSRKDRARIKTRVVCE